MAWPPAAYPLGTANNNATPAKDVHPQLHNDERQAINDIVEKIDAGGGGGGGSSRVLVTGLALGDQAASRTDFTYYAVTGLAHRCIVSRFTVTPTTGGASYDIDVRAAADGSGEQFLSAIGVSGPYDIAWPWYFEHDAADTMYVGVRNTSSLAQTFTLTALRVERFA